MDLNTNQARQGCLNPLNSGFSDTKFYNFKPAFGKLGLHKGLSGEFLQL